MLKIGIIGGGNMASSLVGGLVEGGFDPKNIWVSSTNQAKLEKLQERFAVNVLSNNPAVIDIVNVVLLAVKPQSLRQVCLQIQHDVQRKKSLVISLAAGIRVRDLQRWLGSDVAIVRCMSNTAASVRAAVTGMYANQSVTVDQRNIAEFIIRAVGLIHWVNEEHKMDAVTALSGSGPAYFFLVMEAIAQAGEILGFKQQEAHLLTMQTALGAVRMALESDDSLVQLRANVSSKGGTTERAISVLESAGLRELFLKALQAAHDRAAELAVLFGE